MPAYLVATVAVHDQETYLKYTARTPALIARHGGKFLTRGNPVTTLEGLAAKGRLHAVQQAFIEEQAAQCGYCLNGMVIATVDLLSRHPKPSDEQVRAALSHNLCRCGTHVEILRAVRRAAALLASGRD